MCIERAQQFWLEGRSTGRWIAIAPVDRPVDRLESCALLIWPRSTGRSTGRSSLGHGRPGDRPTGPNGQKFDRWPVDRQVILTCSLTQRLYFEAYLYGAVLDKIFGEFQRQFFPSLLEVFSTYFRVNTSISKRDFFQEYFQK